MNKCCQRYTSLWNTTLYSSRSCMMCQGHQVPARYPILAQNLEVSSVVFLCIVYHMVVFRREYVKHVVGRSDGHDQQTQPSICYEIVFNLGVILCCTWFIVYDFHELDVQQYSEHSGVNSVKLSNVEFLQNTGWWVQLLLWRFWCCSSGAVKFPEYIEGLNLVFQANTFMIRIAN